MGIKINKLELENVKRVKAVALEPAETGLTIIGGNNNQGKTSVLDSIAWVLGGEKFRPSSPERDGSVIPPSLKIKLSNGIIVERTGKNSSLKVIDPSGRKAGQKLLDEFVGQFALNLPKFINSTSREKATALLEVIGVGEQLAELEREERELYNSRLEIGRIADKKSKFAEELPYFPEAPQDLVSASELIKQQQEILARNGENQRKRELAEKYNYELEKAKKDLEAAQKRLEEAEINAADANKSAEDLFDESTEKLEENIRNVDEINRKVRTNLDKTKAQEDAAEFNSKYEKLTEKINSIRNDKRKLLDSAELPLKGLSVEEGELIYNGFRWDGMSGSDQLRVATSIARKLYPKCGFVLMDKLEQMDISTLKEFGAWLEKEELQVIATRVSTGEECSIIIEDGYIKSDSENKSKDEEETNKWRVGDFAW